MVAFNIMKDTTKYLQVKSIDELDVCDEEELSDMVNTEEKYHRSVVLTKLRLAGNIQNKIRIVKDRIIQAYGTIPNEVKVTCMFSNARTLREGRITEKVIVKCDWLLRDRLYEEDGVFPIGALFKCMNKRIMGTTKGQVMVYDKKDSLEELLEQLLK